MAWFQIDSQVSYYQLIKIINCVSHTPRQVDVGAAADPYFFILYTAQMKDDTHLKS